MSSSQTSWIPLTKQGWAIQCVHSRLDSRWHMAGELQNWGPPHWLVNTSVSEGETFIVWGKRCSCCIGEISGLLCGLCTRNGRAWHVFFKNFCASLKCTRVPDFLNVVQIQSTGIYKNRVLRVRFLHRLEFFWLAGIPTSNPTLMTEMQLVNQRVMASCGFLRKGTQFHTYYSKHTYILSHDSWWYSTIFAVTQFVFRFFFTSHMQCQRTNCPYFHFELSSFFFVTRAKAFNQLDATDIPKAVWVSDVS